MQLPAPGMHLPNKSSHSSHKLLCDVTQIQEALDCMPSLLILDDLHLICPAPGDSQDHATASSSAALVEWLCSVLDSFRPAGKPTLPGTFTPLIISTAPVSLSNACTMFSTWSSDTKLEQKSLLIEVQHRTSKRQSGVCRHHDG